MPPDDCPQEELQRLRTTPVFAGLQDDSYIRLANASKIVTIEKGSFLFYQRDPADALYIVKPGELDVVLSNIDGRELIIDKLSVGDQIIVEFNGKRYGYQISEHKEVKPTQTEIEAVSEESKLTLYTCTLKGESDGREVFIAKPLGEVKNGMVERPSSSS